VNSGLLILFGAIYAIMLVGAAMAAAGHKNPWREFAIIAAIGAAMVAVLGALMHLAVSWLMQNPWGFLLLLGFIFVGLCVSAVVGAAGLVARALYRD